MEPDYGYIKENHQSYAQRLALKAGCNVAEVFKDLRTTCPMRFEDVPDERNITPLQPAFSAKRAPHSTGFGINDSGHAIKAIQQRAHFPIQKKMVLHLELNCESYDEQHYSC